MRQIARCAALGVTLCAGVLWAEDAYLESSGGTGINSRYFFNPKSRVEVDFALTDTTTQQQRVWGMDATSPMGSLYRWTRNGEAIAGGEDGDLTVEWEKAKVGTVETYAAVPIYDICGNSSEGVPVSATVEHLSAGTLLLFR